MTRRYRGLQLSQEAHAQLRALARALRRPMYSIVEELVDREYQHQHNDPHTGPLLRALEEVRQLEARLLDPAGGASDVSSPRYPPASR